MLPSTRTDAAFIDKGLAGAECSSPTRVRPLLGTYVSISVDGSDTASALAVEAAFEGIEHIQRLMSFHDPASELSRLNRDGHRAPQRVSPHVRRVLRAALGLARASGGCFDPTVAGRLVAAGMLPPPSSTPVDPDARWSDVHWQPDGRVQYAKPLWLDFGGIAKGYAVDVAVRILWGHGVRSGVVNAGGDLRVFGAPRTINVRNPADPVRALPLARVRDAAVATSAGYFSAVPGRSALMDAATGEDLAASVSVSVCAPRALWADAMTKVVLADPSKAGVLLRRLRATAVLMTDDGRRRML